MIWKDYLKKIQQIKPSLVFGPALFLVLTFMGYFSSRSIVLNKAMFTINFSAMNTSEKIEYRSKYIFILKFFVYFNSWFIKNGFINI